MIPILQFKESKMIIIYLNEIRKKILNKILQ